MNEYRESSVEAAQDTPKEERLASVLDDFSSREMRATAALEALNHAFEEELAKIATAQLMMRMAEQQI